MPKGGLRDGAGRKPGTPNKDVALAREAIAKFVDNNTERLQGWLDDIAKDSPEKAFNCVRDLIEYHVPKLARTETKVSGEITHKGLVIERSTDKTTPETI